MLSFSDLDAAKIRRIREITSKGGDRLIINGLYPDLEYVFAFGVFRQPEEFWRTGAEIVDIVL